MKQARAAGAQASAAIEQVAAAKAQAEAARLQFQEMLLAGTTARRPLFKMIDPDPRFETGLAKLSNIGNGVAFNVTWRFIRASGDSPDNRIGNLGVDKETFLPQRDDPNNPNLQARMIDEAHGIRIDCTDAAGAHYTTVVRRNSQGQYTTDQSTDREA
jgi:hypothetical protein